MIFNIWVTRKCNLKCTYCYEGLLKPEVELERSTALEIIKFIEKYAKERKESSISINFHGGEPLIAFDTIQYIVNKINQHFKTIKVNYGLTTNGTLLNDEIIESLSEIMPYGLSISIDGNKQIHDINRKFSNKHGSYEVIEKYLDKIVSRIPECRARATYNHSTISHLSESVIHLINKGFKTVVAVGDYYDPLWENSDEDILRREIRKLAEYYNTLPNKKEIRINLLDKSLIRYSPCQGGITSINIDIDGKIYPCIAAVGNSKYEIGNVVKGVDINKAKSILDFEIDMHEECKECPINECCNGVRCKLKYQIISGNCLNIPPFLCVEKNAIYDSIES